MKIDKYNSMMKHLTRPSDQMAKQKEYYKKTKIEDKNENKKPIAQRTEGSNYVYDGSSGQFKTEKQLKQQFKEEEQLKNMKINKPDPFQKGLADAMEKYEGKTLKVTYNSATGLFTNPDRDIAFKDADAAHQYNMLIGRGDPPKPKRLVKPFTKVKKKIKIEPMVERPIPTYDPNMFKLPTKTPEDLRREQNFKRMLQEQKQNSGNKGIAYLFGLDE